jgi:hypothetical protein
MTLSRLAAAGVLGLTGLALAGWLLAAQESTPSAWDDLQSAIPETRLRAYQTLAGALDAQRADYVEHCVRILRTDSRGQALEAGQSPRGLAMRMLGGMKADVAVADLVAAINETENEITERTLFSGKPAVGALVEIGLPSVKYILSNARVLTGADEKALRRFALVIRCVFPDAKTAQAFVDAYDPGYTPKARAKLDELKQELAKLP